MLAIIHDRLHGGISVHDLVRLVLERVAPRPTVQATISRCAICAHAERHPTMPVLPHYFDGEVHG